MDTENSDEGAEQKKQQEAEQEDEDDQPTKAAAEELDRESGNQNELFNLIRTQVERQQEEDSELQEFKAQELGASIECSLQFDQI